MLVDKLLNCSSFRMSAHVYMCVGFACLFACVFACTYVCIHVCVYMYICMSECWCVCVCMWVCMYVRTLNLFTCACCACVYMCTYICVHIICVFSDKLRTIYVFIVTISYDCFLPKELVSLLLNDIIKGEIPEWFREELLSSIKPSSPSKCDSADEEVPLSKRQKVEAEEDDKRELDREIEGTVWYEILTCETLYNLVQGNPHCCHWQQLLRKASKKEIEVVAEVGNSVGTLCNVGCLSCVYLYRYVRTYVQ